MPRPEGLFELPPLRKKAPIIPVTPVVRMLTLHCGHLARGGVVVVVVVVVVVLLSFSSSSSSNLFFEPCCSDLRIGF
jgi:hypothetical protein